MVYSSAIRTTAFFLLTTILASGPPGQAQTLKQATINLNTTVSPSGHDDTAAMQAACNKGVLQLTAGVYYVTSITCKAITGFANADAFFWNEGQQPTVKIVGTPAGKRGVIVCPSPGPCGYFALDISPPAGTAGIVLDSVHGANLIDVSVIDDQGGQSSHCVDMIRSGADNQNVIIRGGTYEHCGGWCLEFDVSSDSQVIGTDLANCGKGGIHIGFGYGYRLTGNTVQDMYTAPGIVWDCCGDGNFTGNHFDLNQSDMVLGANGGVYLSASGNSSCRLQGGAMFDVVSAYVIGAANMSCSPTYRVRDGGAVGGGFYDPAPTYFDPATQQQMAGLIH